MRYKNRLLYYAAIGTSAAILHLISLPHITQVVGGAVIFLPIGIFYWVVNELIFGRWLSRKGYEPSVVGKIIVGLLFLAGGIISYGIITHDFLAAQVGVAVLLYAGEVFITRHEENKEKVV